LKGGGEDLGKKTFKRPLTRERTTWGESKKKGKVHESHSGSPAFIHKRGPPPR